MLTRQLGRPKNRWEDDIINDIEKLKIKNWNSRIQDRNKWKLYVERANRSVIEVLAPKEEEEYYLTFYTNIFPIQNKIRFLCPPLFNL